MENISASNQLDDYPNAASENFFEHSNYYTFLVTYLGFTKGRKVSKRNRNRDSLRIINKETERKKEKTTVLERSIRSLFELRGGGSLEGGSKNCMEREEFEFGALRDGLTARNDGGGRRRKRPRRSPRRSTRRVVVVVVVVEF